MHRQEAALRVQFATLLRLRGVAVTYRRGDQVAEFKAVVGGSSTIAGENHGVTLDADLVDWIIRPADLKFDGVATMPIDDDEIVVTVGAETRRYRVSRLDGETPWRFQDESRVTLRAHTKRIT